MFRVSSTIISHFGPLLSSVNFIVHEETSPSSTKVTADPRKQPTQPSLGLFEQHLATLATLSRPCALSRVPRASNRGTARHGACASSARRRSVHGGRRRPRGGSAGSGGGEGGCLLRWNLQPLDNSPAIPFSPSAANPYISRTQ